jgi:hypothetical protein
MQVVWANTKPIAFVRNPNTRLYNTAVIKTDVPVVAFMLLNL